MSGLWLCDGLDSFTIEFDANGGMGSMPDMRVPLYIPGIPTSLRPVPMFVVPRSSFYRAGYRFVGWSTYQNAKSWDAKHFKPGETYSLDTEYLFSYYDNHPFNGSVVGFYAAWDPLPTSVHGARGQFDITLQANEQVTVNNLPAGATYVVNEAPVPSGWTLVRSRDTTGIITPSVG